MEKMGNYIHNTPIGLGKNNFNIIIFGKRKKNAPHSCFVVGHMGCSKITENKHGEAGGIEKCSYTVRFEDGSKQEIFNTICVSAEVV